jgi:hypothetical protein
MSTFCLGHLTDDDWAPPALRKFKKPVRHRRNPIVPMY